MMVEKLHITIMATLKKYKAEDCLFFGLPMSLYQWVPSIIISKLLKSSNPNVFVAIGGIGNSSLANALIESFNMYDFAMWGEGESAIISLAHELSKERAINLNAIPHAYYRAQNNEIIRTTEKTKTYTELSQYPLLDFSDFMDLYNGDTTKISFPIESSRGCHWNRCKFCFLNEGYKYRKKNPPSLASEIRYLIEKYDIFTFSFLDNDVIGGDFVNFDNLLDQLIEIKTKYPKFKILLAEIITKDIEQQYIKKMALAGFVHVQIGYESPSDNILSKICKKNTFASNLLFIKWAFEYNILVGGMNILRGLLDETNEDILESINNIYFLRFFKSAKRYNHVISALAISESSRYYKDLTDTDKSSDAYTDLVKTELPPNYIPKKHEYKIYQFVRQYQNFNWFKFNACDFHFDNNTYSYKLIKSYDNKIRYIEFLNEEELTVLEFDIHSIEWAILCSCNNKIESVTDLYSEFSNFSQTDIENTINSLMNVGILYYNSINRECVTIINTSKII